ncbi:hypothetical protein BDR07DRAFT_882756 [Suillus spraguei]|nr:hypothetical protein BDR07DRAFT_882756 [Suillus spraguei]
MPDEFENSFHFINLNFVFHLPLLFSLSASFSSLFPIRLIVPDNILFNHLYSRLQRYLERHYCPQRSVHIHTSVFTTCSSLFVFIRLVFMAYSDIIHCTRHLSNRHSI